MELRRKISSGLVPLVVILVLVGISGHPASVSDDSRKAGGDVPENTRLYMGETASLGEYAIRLSVLDSGGKLMCSSSYSVGGSVGQIASGASTAASRTVLAGYWAGIDSLPPCAAYACGDCNGDGRVTIADATYLVAYIYRGGPPPLGQGDVNLDSRVTIADATYLVAFIYRGGPPPCQPPVTSR